MDYQNLFKTQNVFLTHFVEALNIWRLKCFSSNFPRDFRSGHNKSLDFYCLGALLYELVVGIPPYYSTNH